MNCWFYIGYAYRSSVLKTDMCFYVLNKNENIVNAGYWVLSENRKN